MHHTCGGCNKITYWWYCCIIYVHRLILLWEQETCHIHLFAVSDGNEAVASHLRGRLFFIFAYDTKKIPHVVNIRRDATTVSLKLYDCSGHRITWRFARRFGWAQRHIGRSAGRQTVQGGCVRRAGLSLPPRHGSVCDWHIQLQDTVDVVLKPKLGHCCPGFHTTCFVKCNSNRLMLPFVWTNLARLAMLTLGSQS